MSKTPGRRTVQCPRCDTPMEVSTATKSTPCPGCHRNIRTEDEVVNDYQARVEYYKEGRVEVGKKGNIIAEVRVTALVVKGEVKGPVRARDSVQLLRGGKITGNVVTPLLTMEEGSVLIGRVETGPRRAALLPPAPAPVAPTAPTAPVR